MTVTEGTGSTVSAVFTVSLSASSNQPVTVNFATENGTRATAPADYMATSGTLTIAAGQTSTTNTVSVAGDSLDEAIETFLVNLTNPVNAGITDSQGEATITDNDLTPTVSINDVTVTEGDSGTLAATFTVRLSGPSGLDASVIVNTANGTATAPADYQTVSREVVFLAGQTSQSVVVNVVGDLLDEPAETFFVRLSFPINLELGDREGVGTITDNDLPPSLRINDIRVTEATGSAVNAVFTVSLSAPSGQNVTVNYAAANGTAVAPADYTSISGTLTFAAGETSKTVTVAVAGDALQEATETFVVNLTIPTNATIADTQRVATIIDNDADEP